MNHATQYHFRNYSTFPENSRSSTTPTIGRVRTLDAKTKRFKRNSKRQTQFRTDSHASDGFLKYRFLPKLKIEESSKDIEDYTILETDFYNSLFMLAEHYGIERMESKEYGYSYNIALALDDAKNQLKQKAVNYDQIALVQEGRRTYFISEERYNTHSTLYYIPIVPLYRMLKVSKRKQTAHLLLSVCAYLYQIADIPYYRQQNSYLFWMYEMVSDWVESDDENQETNRTIVQIKQAELIGELIEKKIYHAENLDRFQERLNRYKILDGLDENAYKLALEALALFEKFPNHNIYIHAQTIIKHDEMDNTAENKIGMHQYISFCAESKGELFQMLFESINMEFQECTEIQEPTLMKRFDGSDISGVNLEFENRIFRLIEQLIELLNQF